MALFGEKYGDEVRVVEVGDYARELCGGTHAARSGQLGVVKLLGEASIGSGIRRVEGLVGLDAYRYLAQEHVLLAQLAETFKVPAEEVPDRVAATVAQLRDAEKELDRLQAQAGARAGRRARRGGARTSSASRTSAPRRRRARPATGAHAGARRPRPARAATAPARSSSRPAATG